MPDKPNILVIWGDDIGITNLSYSDGLMGYRPPEHRSDRGRGDALHRRLRRAELHRRALVVHHRSERLPTGLRQGGPAERAGRTAGGGLDDRRFLKNHGYSTGSSARTTSATGTRSCRRCTASTSSSGTSTT